MPSLQEIVETLANLEGSAAPILFLVSVVDVVLCLPAAWLAFSAGALLGLVKGTLVVNLAGVTSAALVRLLAHGPVGRPVLGWLERSPKLSLIRRVLEDGGWKLTLLIRLSPALPLGLTHWLFGFVRLPLPVYLLVTAVATFPAQLMWAHFGVTGRQGIELWAHPETADPLQLAFMATSVVATVASVTFLGVLARRRVQVEMDRARVAP